MKIKAMLRMIFITSGSARTGIVFRCAADHSYLGNNVEDDIMTAGDLTVKDRLLTEYLKAYRANLFQD